ncbi:MAG: helix-hairpin-helix domain-containing protein [Actinobacteria bacterium]|nr:helix-hairpin-helix domain-containing protein [Actinomycetota bacterium]
MASTEPPPPRQGPSERARRLLAAAGCGPPEIIALGILLTGALAAVGVLWLASRPGTVAGGRDPLLAPRKPARVVVHVAGEVRDPGLYRLKGGARIADALQAADGPRRTAAVDGLNLAQPLVDGEQIVVPGQVAAAPAAGAGGGEGPAGDGVQADGTVDLNLATPEELEELPDIGPVLAAAIVDHRETVGPFRTVDQLDDVSGIGEITLANLRPLVSV